MNRISMNKMSGLSQRGVTMVELIITVAIVSILATMAAPSFITMLDRNRIKGAAETLYSEMQFARSESVYQDRAIVLSFTKTSNSDWCYGLTDVVVAPATVVVGCDCTAANSCMVGGTERVTESSDLNDMPLTTLTFNTAGLLPLTSTRFNPLRGTSDNGTAGFTSPLNNQVNVVLSTVSRVRYCSPAGAANVFNYPNC